MQDTLGVEGVLAIDADWVADQARCLLEDMPVDAFKIGVLGSVENIAAIAEIVSDYPDVPLILDPVLASGRGDELASDEMTHALRELLLPQTTILTPNSIEVRRLAEHDDDEEPALARMRGAARSKRAASTCSSPARTKRRRRSSTRSTRKSGVVRTDTWPRLPGSYHGSGCTLASAIAAMLANGLELPEAVREAQDYTWQTLKKAYRPGHGPVPARPSVLGARGERARPPTTRRAPRRRRCRAAATDDALARRAPRAAHRAASTRSRRTSTTPRGSSRASTRRSPAAPPRSSTGNKTRRRRAAPRAGARARARCRGRAARSSSSTTTRRSPREVGADGVHLGEDDGDVGRARAIARAATALIGVSCYDDLARARRRGRGGRRLRRVRQLLPVGDEAAARGARTSTLLRARARARRAGRRDRRHRRRQRAARSSTPAPTRSP